MVNINRRDVMKSIGSTSIGIGGLSSVGSANATENEPRTNELGFGKERLETAEKNRYISKVWSSAPVKEMRSFLKKEKGTNVKPSDFKGYKVSDRQGTITATSSQSDHDFVLLRTPVSPDEEEVTGFVIRIQNNDVYVTATVDSTPYKINPLTVEKKSGFIAQNKTPEGYDIITSSELSRHESQITKDPVDTGFQIAASGVDCVQSITLSLTSDYVPNWLCELVYYMGWISLVLYPEPTSSATGIGIITITAASGGCSVSHTIEDETGISSFTICYEGNDCYMDGIRPICTPQFTAHTN